MAYLVKEVANDKEFKKFYQFQNELYKNCEVYVPSLDRDQKKTLSQAPPLEYCKQKLFLAWDEKGEVVGRINAIINPRYNELYGTKRMRFGWFDFKEDIEIARQLLDAAIAWGISEGMDEIHGPLGYNTMYKQGMVVEGFDSIPPVNCLYNYSYYPKFMEELGYTKECDWIQYKLGGTQALPEKLQRISNMLMQRYNLRIVDVEKLKKDSNLIADFFYNFNRSFMTVHNFVPLTEAEIKEEGRQYIGQMKSDLTCFVLDEEDKIATFGITTPFISKAFKKAGGKLFPFGWWHILRGMKNYEALDLMMVGSDPKWAGKGLSAIFYTHLTHNFQNMGIKYAITNPQIEDNPAIKVWDSFPDRELYIRRRCYIKKIR